MEQQTINILGYECTLAFNYYPNKTVAITAIANDEETFCCTVNWEDNWHYGKYNKRFCFPVVVIKDYGENEGIANALEKGGVIERGGAYMENTGGTVHVRLLTKQWQEIAEQQLKKLKTKR